MQIYKEFSFDAAHSLPYFGEGHRNARLHGHSFRVIVVLEGEPDPATGTIMNLDDVTDAVGEARTALDHMHLNDIDGLELPTLENISRWLWARLSEPIPGLKRIEVHRDSCREGCIYEGPAA